MPPNPAVTGGVAANGSVTANGGLAANAASGTAAETEGMQFIAPATDNTVRALADITRDGRGPMVLTFLARDDQDYARLAATLASFASANLRQNLNTVLSNGQTPLANVTPQDDPRNGLRQVPATVASNNFVQNGNSVGANNDRQAVPFNNGTANTSSNVSVGVTAGGVLVFKTTPAGNNDTNANGGNGAALPSNQALYPDQNLIANDYSGGRYLNDNSRATMLNVREATVRGGPYRVALRADQLEELSRTYRMALAARGDVVFQFHALGDQAPLTADLKERVDLLRKAGLEFDNSGSAQLGIRNSTAAAPALPAAGSSAPRGTAPAAARPAPATAPTVQNAAREQQKDIPATIECVITMEPAPASTRPSAAPGASPPAP